MKYVEKLKKQEKRTIIIFIILAIILVISYILSLSIYEKSYYSDILKNNEILIVALITFILMFIMHKFIKTNIIIVYIMLILFSLFLMIFSLIRLSLYYSLVIYILLLIFLITNTIIIIVNKNKLKKESNNNLDECRKKSILNKVLNVVGIIAFIILYNVLKYNSFHYQDCCEKYSANSENIISSDNTCHKCEIIIVDWMYDLMGKIMDNH